MNVLVKSTVREIKNSVGRYLAILAITALGVGFFAGLRACRPSMIDTAGKYFEAQNFYDYCLVSSVGFSKDSVDAFLEQEEIADAQGACYEDLLLIEDENELVFRIHALTERINHPRLTAGRMPQSDRECVVDADYFKEDAIGKTLVISGANQPDRKDAFTVSEFRIVGIVTAPLYISNDRGMASVGDGTIQGCLYVNPSCFTADYYKELYVTLEKEEEAYSDAYDKRISREKAGITRTAEEQARLRSQELLAGIRQEYDGTGTGMVSLPEPTVYVLTRSENEGYAAFEKDAAIIENISVVFPAFFFLVAALVCVTTMMRMVDEQRTQIGVWKAMGYGKGKITAKYLFYAASAGLIGGIGGFFAGTALIPDIFWYAYRDYYNFTKQLQYTFDWKMYVSSLVIALLCTAGVTWICCLRELREVPAEILRPKAPRNGRRILLERFTHLWRRISFLHKVSLRNVIRYKLRFVLMILGISGCTALLLTGFGIRDSIQDVTDYQYGEIVLYDAEAAFTEEVSTVQQEDFCRKYEEIMESIVFLLENKADIEAGGVRKSAKLTAVLQEDLTSFWHLHASEAEIAYPQEGELILSRGLADKLHIEKGERIRLTGSTNIPVTAVVAGIFDNYIGNYVFVSEELMVQLEGRAAVNAAYVNFKEGDKGLSSAAARMLDDGNVSHITLNEEMKKTIEASFSSLDLIVLLIIFCAGVLAFIVLFNLININIGERIREIATLKVLGFFHIESAAYVFREVNLLTMAGALLGLLLGRFLHIFVMSQIHSDDMCFDNRIAWSSYVLSVVITLAFAGMVKLAMRHKLKRIPMAESLKSVE